jgi:hypothetical protein
MTPVDEMLSAVKIWSDGWKTIPRDGWVNLITPLGEIKATGPIPYNAPFGIDWLQQDIDLQPGGDAGLVTRKHYDTQQALLEILSDAVSEDILLNPNNIILLVDLTGQSFPGLIFSNDTYFYGVKLASLKTFEDAEKNVDNTRNFYNNLLRGVRTDTYPTIDYKEQYSDWKGWLDGEGDFYKNLSDMIRELMTHQFDNQEETMTNLEDQDMWDFTKVWIVVEKPLLLPLLLNWNEESAKQLWNLLSR